MDWTRTLRQRLANRVAKSFSFPILPDARSPSNDGIATWEPTVGAHTAAVSTMSDLIAIYMASRRYNDLSTNTKNSYEIYLRRINEKFGAVPLADMEKRGARASIREWRDHVLSKRPRSADSTIGVLRRLLNFGLDEEYVFRNPAAALGSLHTKTRRDIIWSDSQISEFQNRAPRHLARVMLLALWTGQRQSDLLHLKWSDYDGTYICLQQKKSSGGSGRRVKILVSKELRSILSEIEEEQIALSQHPIGTKRVKRPQFVLTTSYGKPWRRGFRASWRKAVDSAGIQGVTFHDLRGTFITLSHRAGATIRQIAEASGHDEHECERVIRHHYLATGAERVVEILETDRRFATPHWEGQRAQNSDTATTYIRFTGPRRRSSV